MDTAGPIISCMVGATSVFDTEKAGLKTSCVVGEEIRVLETENAALNKSCVTTGDAVLMTETAPIRSSPCIVRSGRLVGSAGSDPNNNSRPSGKPSPSLSPSSCVLMIESLFPAVGSVAPLPKPFVPTRTKLPCAIGATKIGSVAEVPAPLTCGVPNVMAGGFTTGTTANVDPARFAPIIWMLDGGWVASIAFGVIAKTIGTGP